MTTIVVGVDGSAAARDALLWACEEARLRDADLTVVHAWLHPYGGTLTGMAEPKERMRADAAEVLDAAVSLAAEHPGMDGRVRGLLVEDAPAQAVLGAAGGADLVVVGSRGHGGFASLLLGSVSHQVAHHAPCPVVVVPGTAHPAGSPNQGSD